MRDKCYIVLAYIRNVNIFICLFYTYDTSTTELERDSYKHLLSCLYAHRTDNISCNCVDVVTSSSRAVLRQWTRKRQMKEVRRLLPVAWQPLERRTCERIELYASKAHTFTVHSEHHVSWLFVYFWKRQSRVSLWMLRAMWQSVCLGYCYCYF